MSEDEYLRQKEEDINQRVAAARANRQRLERERKMLHGPSRTEVFIARNAERQEWKRSLPFWARPWFWIVIAAFVMVISVPAGLLIVAIHATGYQIAKSNAVGQ